jgi:hypothetical protein
MLLEHRQRNTAMLKLCHAKNDLQTISIYAALVHHNNWVTLASVFMGLDAAVAVTAESLTVSAVGTVAMPCST